MAIHYVILILTIVMAIGYCRWLLVMVIHYLILLMIIVMAVGFGYQPLLMAIDYYEWLLNSFLLLVILRFNF